MASNIGDNGPQNWHEFSQETSMHGVKNIGDKGASKGRRVVWLLLTLVWLAYFCYAGGHFLYDCSQKLLYTKISVEQTDTIRFPTVTICNNNMLARRYIKQVEEDIFQSDALSEIFRELFAAHADLPPPVDKFRSDDPRYYYFHRMPANDTERFLKDAAHPLKFSISKCIVFGKITDCEDVFEVVPTDAGYCFQLNSNGAMNATAAGKTGGVEFRLNAQVDEYTTGPNSVSEGFSLTFHEAHEVPLVSELSYGVEPGVQASIMLHKSETKRYPPWADGGRATCFDTAKLPNPLLVYKNYSRSACQAECVTRYVIDKCGCRDARQPAIHNKPVCTLMEMLYCSQPAIHDFPGDSEGLAACKCKDPCIDSEYSAKISTYKYPNANYIDESGGDYEYVKRNMMLVNIFYGKLYYTTLEERLAYGFMEAVSNVGGTLGLCIGASLLTVMEYFEFGILSFVRFVSGAKKRQKGSRVKVSPEKDRD